MTKRKALRLTIKEWDELSQTGQDEDPLSMTVKVLSPLWESPKMLNTWHCWFKAKRKSIEKKEYAKQVADLLRKALAREMKKG